MSELLELRLPNQNDTLQEENSIANIITIPNCLHNFKKHLFYRLHNPLFGFRGFSLYILKKSTSKKKKKWISLLCSYL